MAIFLIGCAGILGTTAMVAIMSLIHHMKWANADMVRAIGSVYTKSRDLSLFYGLMTHYSFGIFFAFAYSALFSVAPVISSGSIIIIGTLTGLVHGLMVGLLLSVVVAEHHPDAKFRRVGIDVALAHVVGHIAYGAALSVFIAMNWNHIASFLESITVGKMLGELVGFSVIWVPLFGIPLFFGSWVVYSFTKSHDVRKPAAQIKMKKPRETKSKHEKHEKKRAA